MRSISNYTFILVLMIGLFTCLTAQSNLLPNADLETLEPNFWLPNVGGTGHSWATDEVAPGTGTNFRSFKIEKPSTTTEAVSWVSVDNADLYWNNAAGNVVYDFSFWAKTSGVNTNPANNDAEIGVRYTFLVGGNWIEQFVAVDQSNANVDWTEYTGSLLVPSEPTSVVMYAQMGKDATGTVWFDNIGCGTDPWSMGCFGGNAETPVGWMSWASGSDVGFANLVDSYGRNGSHCVLLYEADLLADEMVFYSEPVPAQPDKWYAFSVWIRTDSINTNVDFYGTTVTPDRLDERLGLTFFFHRSPLSTAWDLTGGDQFYYVDQLHDTLTWWKHYVVAAKAPSDAAGVSIRARFTSFPYGYAWYDDFAIVELADQPNLMFNADLETMEPNFWTPNAGGTGHTWATDEVAPGTGTNLRSFKIDKAGVTADAVSWVSDDNADLYWNNAAGNVVYDFSFWAKTSGVNTNPVNNDAEIGVRYTFLVGGNWIEQFVAVDQSNANVDWTEYTGSLLVPSEPTSVVMYAQMGKDATGTVWFDNIGCGTDPWSMGCFGGNAETPVGWMSWASGSDVGFAALDNTYAYSGSYSALLYEADNLADEMVFYSEPATATADKWYKLSVMVRTDSMNAQPNYYSSNITPDRLDQRAGLTFFFHRSPLMTAWDLTGGDQFFYIDQLADTLTDWKEYIVIAESPSDAAGVSVRARFTSFPYGYGWYDDFRIEELAEVITLIEPEPTPISNLVPHDFVLQQNYPNPFNPETIIEFKVPELGPVVLSIFNTLGQKIRTLVNDHRAPGTYQVFWDGRDDHGNYVATGMYLYQLRGENALITKKMFLIK